MHRLDRKLIAKSGIAVTNHVLSGEYLPMVNASYDTVICTFTLYSITDVSQTLFKFNRVNKNRE